ncbi:lysophospholipase [Kitasatospora sp. NBC_00085]|uniref:alpha/beta fold hydrolase n=1 Tax=unclassified Kitasatospora TaxID=2633591 RepID=UPI003250BA49
MAIERVKPKLVFVHGIGGRRDAQAELTDWKRALAEGARESGYASEISALTAEWSADCSFAYYGDLFASDRQAQGSAGAEGLDEDQTDIVLGLLEEFLGELAVLPEHRDNRRLARIRAQVRPDGEAQGIGNAGRHLSSLLAAVASLPGLSWGARKLSQRELLGILSQPGRYLRRAESDESGRTLDQRIRERVLDCLDPGRPTIVVAHSLGTVVALEALAEYRGPVELFVTVGSPIAMRGFIWPLLRPRPPATPESVAAWLDFRDGDDVVVPKRRLADLVAPNTAGVQPVPDRLESALFWSHTATTYLRRQEIAKPVMETLAAWTARS